jgi:hypothetical protein
MSVVLQNCAAENYFYDCCEGNVSEGRIRGVAWVKKGVWSNDVTQANKLTPANITDNTIWQGIVAANLGFIIQNVRGTYDGSSASESPGYGSQSLRLSGRSHQVTYNHLFTWTGNSNTGIPPGSTLFEHNVDFYSWLNKQSSYEFYFVTDKHIWRTRNAAMSFTQIPISENIENQVEYVVTVKWSQIDLPGVYLRCEQISTGERCLQIFENCDYLNPASVCWQPAAVTTNTCITP